MIFLKGWLQKHQNLVARNKHVNKQTVNLCIVLQFQGVLCDHYPRCAKYRQLGSVENLVEQPGQKVPSEDLKWVYSKQQIDQDDSSYAKDTRLLCLLNGIAQWSDCAAKLTC
eukprot:TRINITY_DN5809_c0_g1_i2.p3 TRINITY_DN5809_c0_g1~~TRINITY_DN5809_c0_g1_i2.p3  ORF type:complete len:112 (+),score=2.82 TRINITY_DN5809_c0_g1_i2:41-376(+)